MPLFPRGAVRLVAEAGASLRQGALDLLPFDRLVRRADSLADRRRGAGQPHRRLVARLIARAPRQGFELARDAALVAERPNACSASINDRSATS